MKSSKKKYDAVRSQSSSIEQGNRAIGMEIKVQICAIAQSKPTNFWDQGENPTSRKVYITIVARPAKKMTESDPRSVALKRPCTTFNWSRRCCEGSFTSNSPRSCRFEKSNDRSPAFPALWAHRRKPSRRNPWLLTSSVLKRRSPGYVGIHGAPHHQ